MKKELRIFLEILIILGVAVIVQLIVRALGVSTTYEFSLLSVVVARVARLCVEAKHSGDVD